MTNNIATIEFAAPGALGAEVVGTQRDNSVTVQNFQVPTALLDATHETDPAATISYDFGIRRGTNTTIVSTTAGMLRDNRPTQGLRPGFPTKQIAPGQFQFVIIQRAGALTATNVVVHANNPVF
jgi:hypothetical protein